MTGTKKHTVLVGEAGFQIDLLDDGSFLVDGKPADVSIHRRDSDRFDLRLADRIYDVEIMRRDPDGSIELLLYGKTVRVQVDDEKSLLLKRFSIGQSRRHHAAHIKAPMPGKIVKVLVREGDEVTAGQGVVILEAMKMENEIKATNAGVVKSVVVRDHDAVEKNAVLVEIE